MSVEMTLKPTFSHDQYESYLNEANISDRTTQEAVYYYINDGYKQINKTDRGNFDWMFHHLNSIATISNFGKKTLYRGVKEFDITFTVGDTITFSQLTSTTSDPAIVSRFINKENPIIFIIETTKGVPVSLGCDEYEWLLPADSIYNVLSIKSNVPVFSEYFGTDFRVKMGEFTVVKLAENSGL